MLMFKIEINNSPALDISGLRVINIVKFSRGIYFAIIIYFFLYLFLFIDIFIDQFKVSIVRENILEMR